MAQFGKSDWMDKKKTFTIDYTRISDNQQSKEDSKQKDPKKKPALIEQRKFIENGDGGRKSDFWVAEVASGTDRDRAGWAKVMAKAQEMTAKGYRVYIRVKDPSRASRNTQLARRQPIILYVSVSAVHAYALVACTKCGKITLKVA